MPNPVPLATKEEEERRAWVTAHHEVVRLIKDCFGDRFSNNEIFDRLKISRRTGYRALGNDDRIGKAPGRKPKISDDTIRSMIEYIETGGCNDVGNVWKHLAEKFASDCNPKTVQDAVKKSGFKNYRNTVKLEPLLNEEIPDNQPTPDEENAAHLQQQQQQEQQKSSYQLQQDQQQQHSQQDLSRQQHSSQQQHLAQQQNVIDPSFQQYNIQEILRQAIETSPEVHVRYILWAICARFEDAEKYVSSILIPHVAAAAAPSLPPMSSSQMNRFDPGLGGPSLNSPGPDPAKRPRLAICRRCAQQYDRSENTMENRSCLYHKGSPQKITPGDIGTIEESPEAYIWSCCGGNGMVRGCCRAMHTTKKKRKYGKKRDATEADLDADQDQDQEGDHEDEDTGAEESHLIGVDTHLDRHPQNGDNTDLGVDDPNIDASLQDMPPPTSLSSNIALQMFSTELPTSFLQHGTPHSSGPQSSSIPSSLQIGRDSPASAGMPPPTSQITTSHQLPSNGHTQMSHDVQAQFQLAQAQAQVHSQS